MKAVFMGFQGWGLSVVGQFEFLGLPWSVALDAAFALIKRYETKASRLQGCVDYCELQIH